MAFPLLHSITGGGGTWDEIVLMLFIGALLGTLVTLSYLSSRRKRKGRKRTRPR